MGVFLSILLWVCGVPVNVNERSECLTENRLMGFYSLEEKQIFLCEKNIASTKITHDEVIKHELVHFIHDSFDVETTIIPEPYFTFLVRNFMDDDEKLYVIMHGDDVGEELESRLISRMPVGALYAALLAASIK